MPPKKASAPSKKVEQKNKEKVIEDKTFGLKNKKGAKQQRFIQNVTHQVKYGNQAAKKTKTEQDLKNDKREKQKREKEELNALFRPVQAVPKDADPKSIVCAFYKQGQCGKGDKCKFSHDLGMQRKAEKRNMYVDSRENENEDDTMENWDEDKLKEVVEKKHAEADSKKPKTDIVCKFFLQAIESGKYGWFWQCPNSTKCIYRHALPPGFVLKTNKKKDDLDQEESISLEELIEEERARLASQSLTRITLESFLAWKKKKMTEKRKNLEASMKKKKSDFKMGKALGVSGREVFEFKPELVDADDDEADDTKYVRENESDEEDQQESVPIKANEVTLENLAAAAQEADGTGTMALDTVRHRDNNATHTDTRPGPEQAEEEVAGAAAAALVDGVHIDEQLFDQEEALDIDEELFSQEMEELDI